MEISLRLNDYHNNIIRKALIVMNDSYIIDRKVYTALSCIQKIQEIQKSRWQKIKGNKYKNKCRKARLLVD